MKHKTYLDKDGGIHLGDIAKSAMGQMKDLESATILSKETEDFFLNTLAKLSGKPRKKGVVLHAYHKGDAFKFLCDDEDHDYVNQPAQFKSNVTCEKCKELLHTVTWMKD